MPSHWRWPRTHSKRSGSNLSKKSPARHLADWTRLSADQFGAAYSLTAPRETERRWPLIQTEVVTAKTGRGEPVTDRDIILEACVEAQKFGFIADLARGVAYLEMDTLQRDPIEAAQMLKGAAGSGVMQGLTKRARGLMDASIFRSLDSASQACARVLANGQPKGTAFLVGPDLVLTAAHVVFKDDGASEWRSELLDNLTFEFLPPPDGGKSGRIAIPPAGHQPLVDSSLPYGWPPNLLNEELCPTAANQLDYALIRLDRTVSHVTPIDIRQPDAVQQERTCFVIGFGGGTGLAFDADMVVKRDDPSARWLHLANTVPGMSGGCCIGPEGKVVGLHEGNVPIRDEHNQIKLGKRGEELTTNRGISLAAIRAGQKTREKDVLEPAPVIPGFEDRVMVEQLYRDGLRLAGGDRAQEWRDLVQQMMGLDRSPAEAPAFPSFHPWLPRSNVEHWIDGRKPAQKLAFVIGDEGTGKSFCAQILKAKIPDAISDLVYINATQTSAWSFPEALKSTAPEAADRTTAGAWRYDDVPSIIQRWSPDINPRRSAANPMFVAIDFETNPAGLRFGQQPWLQFIDLLAAEDWVRIMLIGLNEVERDVLLDQPHIKTLERLVFDLPHLGVIDLETYAEVLARARGSGKPRSELMKVARAQWNNPAMLHGQRPQLHTVEVALAAIAFNRSLSG